MVYHALHQALTIWLTPVVAWAENGLLFGGSDTEISREFLLPVPEDSGAMIPVPEALRNANVSVMTGSWLLSDKSVPLKSTHF